MSNKHQIAENDEQGETIRRIAFDLRRLRRRTEDDDSPRATLATQRINGALQALQSPLPGNREWCAYLALQVALRSLRDLDLGKDRGQLSEILTDMERERDAFAWDHFNARAA